MVFRMMKAGERLKAEGGRGIPDGKNFRLRLRLRFRPGMRYKVEGWRGKAEGWRLKTEGRRAKGEGRKAKGERRKAKGEIRTQIFADIHR
jgi:hypothetical protein